MIGYPVWRVAPAQIDRPYAGVYRTDGTKFVPLMQSPVLEVLLPRFALRPMAAFDLTFHHKIHN
jgi:hypothetical protein